MKVTVFGGTGVIGHELVADLLFRGFQVTAFVSASAQPPTAWRGNVAVVVGELTDAEAVDTAVAGSEAVINALDPRLRPRSREQCLVQGTRHIVASMHRHGVRRYVGHGTPVVTLCPRDRPTAHIRWHRFLARRLHPHAYRHMTEMLQVVTGSGLDWTIVRFMHVSHGSARGLKYVGFFGPDPVGSSATAADIARFTVTQILGTAYIHDAPAVSN